jgi:hypothetical protein
MAIAGENTLTGGRVVVFGNSIFASDQGFDAYGNGDMFVNSVDWTAEQENLASITPRTTTERVFNAPFPDTLDPDPVELYIRHSGPGTGRRNLHLAGPQAAGIMYDSTLNTVVYITILLALAAVYYYLNNRGQPADIEITPGSTEEISYLFKAEEGIPTRILIQSRSGEAVEVARNAGNAWALVQPVETEAEQGSAEAAASQLPRCVFWREFPTSTRSW